MPATIAQNFRITRIEAAPIAASPGTEARPNRVMVSAAPAGEEPAAQPMPAFTWPFDNADAASFFVVNEEVTLTFSKPAT